MVVFIWFHVGPCSSLFVLRSQIQDSANNANMATMNLNIHCLECPFGMGLFPDSSKQSIETCMQHDSSNRCFGKDSILPRVCCCSRLLRMYEALMATVFQVVAEGEQLMVSIAGSAMRFFWKLQLLCPPLFEWKWRNGMEQLKAYNKYSQPFEEIRTRVEWLGWARLGNRCLFSGGWDGVMVG